MTYRMQILVDDKARENLLWLAEDNNISISKLIRDLAEKEAKTRKKVVKKSPARMLLDIAKRAEQENWTGPADLSTNDDYIY